MTEAVIDLPCDVQQVDGTGDSVDPVLARVVSLTDRPTGVKVHLEILPGEPSDYAEALGRSHLLT